MMASSLQFGELEASSSRSGDIVSLSFRGNADGRADSALESFLHKLHAEFSTEAVRQVDVDIRGLEFMNSSCFKGFITWIVQVAFSIGGAVIEGVTLCDGEAQQFLGAFN